MAYSSPTKYRSGGSPIRSLDERFSSRRLAPILEEERDTILARTLMRENDSLNEINHRLVEGEEELRGRVILMQRQLEIKDREIQSMGRDVRMIRDRYQREIADLKEQNRALLSKNFLLQQKNAQELSSLKAKYIHVTLQETNLLKKGMEGDIHRVLGELQTARLLLEQKQKELAHLSLVGHRNSSEYSANLQSLISQNNVLRNKLVQFEMMKNKELHEVENKKELERSRTVGIMSYCKQNNFFIEKEITRLAEQLLEKNISIESFTKELLKQRKQFDQAEKKYQDTVSKLKQHYEQLIKDKESSAEKLEKFYKDELAEQKKIEIGLQQSLASKEHELETLGRQLDYSKNQILLKNREIQELKESISRMHEDHSKELSKVMLNSKMKRSGANMSSYSSNSFENIEDGQGSSIIKSGRLQRQLSFSNQGSGSARLPTVREELAASHGNLQSDDEDIEVKQLIMHYESMIDQIKKNKSLELDIANQKIQGLKTNLNEKQQQILDILNRFSPLMEFKLSPMSIQEERRAKIEQHYKADIDLLSVMLNKYQIVALKKR